MPQMNVESFNLDHRAVKAPYVRVADVKQLPHGDVITKYDIRFTQPNNEHLEMPTIHSLEHGVAESIRNHSDGVLDFSPMGCQTGFYLVLVGQPDTDLASDLVDKALTDLLDFTEVPAANETQCGWGASHSLEGAKEAARTMLAARSQWHIVMDDAAASGDGR